MDWFINLLQTHSELAIFLTVAIGFFIGKLKFKNFSLGTVTSVLLIGVLIGQLDIKISEPVKSVFFLMFLFAVGYKVGPQFFRGLKKDGLPQVWFALSMLVCIFVITWLSALIMGYNPGEAAGLLSGSQTISAVIGVSGDTINSLRATDADKAQWTNMIPVAYAVTYIFGTAGSAWILATFGPKLLGGIEKVKKSCKELEEKLGRTASDNPGYINAERNVSFRSFEVKNEWFSSGKTVSELESYYKSIGLILFVERLKKKDTIIDKIAPDIIINIGDCIVLSGSRQYMMGEDIWIGKEVYISGFLNFPIEILPVVIHNKKIAGKTVEEISNEEFMEGVSIRSIKRSDIPIPVFPKTIIDACDNVEIMGREKHVEKAGKILGYIDRPTNVADMIFIGLGIFIGGMIGALAINLGGIPISLSTSGGTLIAGLFCGWWRSKMPTFGQIPNSTLWFMNNVGLNLFIAVIGINAGPSFIDGLKEIGPSLLLVGAITTSLPLILGVIIARYIFHLHPALCLGCTAGARTTTAALGAVQDAVKSDTPALGYTITYAVGNTLLIIWGVLIVLLIS